MTENNKKGIEIPGFVNKNTEEDVDMSVFQLDEEEGQENQNTSPAPKRPYKKERIIIVVLIAFLAISIASGTVYLGVNKYREMKAAEEAKIAEQKRQEEEAKAKEEEAKRLEEEKRKQEEEQRAKLGTYTLQLTVRLRQGPGTNYDSVSYDSLPSSLKEKIDDIFLPEGMKVEVLELKEDKENNMTWGRIGDNIWFCVKEGNDNYAVKEVAQ